MNLPFTASWPTAYACPKMFIAEHLYTPASLPFKFCTRKVSSDANDWLIFVWLFNLLQTTVGVGLPITEHLNVADPLSFIVDLAGETANRRCWNWFTRLSFRSRHACRPSVSFLSLRTCYARWSNRSHDALLATFSWWSHNSLISFVSLFPSLSSSSPGSFLSSRSGWTRRSWWTNDTLWLTDVRF